MLLPLIAVVAETSSTAVWAPTSVRDLHREYNHIFKFGNRNAASHLWSTFLFDRASHMTASTLEMMFSGFCAVSGSPTRPSDYTRYRLTLPVVGGGTASGYMYYCCWPCVCDTQDFIRVDTKNVTLAGGESRQYHWAVVGNPCDDPSKLHAPFVQPFHGRGETTLAREAAEVRCDAEGRLIGATLSDHGYPIISMFFDVRAHAIAACGLRVSAGALARTPARPSRGALAPPIDHRLARCGDSAPPTRSPKAARAFDPRSQRVPAVCRPPAPRAHAARSRLASQAVMVTEGWTAVDADGGRAAGTGVTDGGAPQPGRVSRTAAGVAFQDEYEYGPMCAQRAAAGYNSGMGEIFRKVAAISPVRLTTRVAGAAELPAPAAAEPHSSTTTAAAQATRVPAPAEAETVVYRVDANTAAAASQGASAGASF